jgi:hypothetical protein
MTTDRNKKLPKPAWSDPESGIEPQYPYLYGQRDNNGGYEFKYRNLNDHTVSSSETYLPSGSYETIQYHPETGEVKTRLNKGDEYIYGAGGVSTHIDGHSDTAVKSTSRTNISGDSAVHVGRNSSSMISGQSVTASGPSINRSVPRSDTITYNSSGGDVINEHTGNYHESYEKDFVTAVKQNAVFMVNEGDYAVHVQSGSYDAYIKNKARIYADSDILFESKSKITLKVGGSTIVISPDSIVVNSARIDLN